MKKEALLLFATLTSATALNAAVLVSWETGATITGSGSNKEWPTDTVASGLGADSWMAGTGINADDSSAWNSDRFRFFRPNNGDNPGQGTEAQAVSEGDYFEFSISPDAGQQVSIDSLNIFGGTNNGTVELQLRSSLDSFASGLGSNEIVAEGNPDSVHTWNLPGTSHDNLTTTVTFRLYGWGTVSKGHTLDFAERTGGEDLWVEGTVSAVPEPALFGALAGLAGLGVVALRRRRGK